MYFFNYTMHVNSKCKSLYSLTNENGEPNDDYGY